jgi:molybdenum cofactor biosynthesis enzyme MoaA
VLIKGGEGLTSSSIPLRIDEIITLLTNAANFGFTSIKFTGGEPFLRSAPDLARLLTSLRDCGRFEDIELVTNGTLMYPDLDLLSSTLSLLTVSMDTLNRKKYASFTGRDLLRNVLSNVERLYSSGVPLRINCVLTKTNYNEVPKILQFAQTLKAELKLSDLLLFRIPQNMTYEYCSPRSMVGKLGLPEGKHEILTPPGGFGVSMWKFTTPKGTVIVKDSAAGTVYNRICRNCAFFPCQDGLYALRVTHDGMLRMCWPREDLVVPYGGLNRIHGQLEMAHKWYSYPFFCKAWQASGGTTNNGKDIHKLQTNGLL